MGSGVPAGDGRADDAGFTLVEVLVSLLLIGLVATFAVRFQLDALSGTRYQANREAAYSLASSVLEEAGALGGPALWCHTGTTAETRTVASVDYRVSWTVTRLRTGSPVLPPTPCVPPPPVNGVWNTARVDVTVSWADRPARPVTATAEYDAATAEPVFT